MSWESALQSAIEVAIGIAGFSGIVGAVAGRTGGQWDTDDYVRLRVLLTASGIALVFAFLPFLLVDSFESEQIWRSLSALLAIVSAGITIYRGRQSRSRGAVDSVVVSGIPGFVYQAPIILLMCSNAIWFASASVYVFCVLWGLIAAFVVFAQLLLDAARRGVQDDRPSV
jgi:hypothetical protein